MTTKLVGLLNSYFYFFMSILIAVIVVFGFSHTVGERLIHPTVALPPILYFHAAIFGIWVLFFIFQSALVQTHNLRLHRLTGWFGAALGATIPVLGISTAITMARFRILHSSSSADAAFILVPFFDIFAFTISFALAIYWRKNPEFHRRLVLIATCALTAAAFGRFPSDLLTPNLFYTGVDLLVLFGVARDLIVNRRIHQVYLYALSALVLCQTVVMYTIIHKSPYWLQIANAILR